MSDKTIRELQTQLPWTGHYHRDFRATPMTHKDFDHALLHVHKAGGKLAGIINDAEHGGVNWADPKVRADVQKYVADLVICALRMATTCPEGQIDLQRAVEERLFDKNNQLAEDAKTLRSVERMGGRRMEPVTLEVTEEQAAALRRGTPISVGYKVEPPQEGQIMGLCTTGLCAPKKPEACKLDTDGDGNCPVHPRGCPEAKR